MSGVNGNKKGPAYNFFGDYVAFPSHEQVKANAFLGGYVAFPSCEQANIKPKQSKLITRPSAVPRHVVSDFKLELPNKTHAVETIKTKSLVRDFMPSAPDDIAVDETVEPNEFQSSSYRKVTTFLNQQKQLINSERTTPLPIIESVEGITDPKQKRRAQLRNAQRKYKSNHEIIRLDSSSKRNTPPPALKSLEGITDPKQIKRINNINNLRNYRYNHKFVRKRL